MNDEAEGHADWPTNQVYATLSDTTTLKMKVANSYSALAIKSRVFFYFVLGWGGFFSFLKNLLTLCSLTIFHNIELTNLLFSNRRYSLKFMSSSHEQRYNMFIPPLHRSSNILGKNLHHDQESTNFGPALSTIQRVTTCT